MILCSHHHVEICHDDLICPLCKKIDECADLEKENSRLETDLASAESRADDAEARADEAETIIANAQADAKENV